MTQGERAEYEAWVRTVMNDTSLTVSERVAKVMAGRRRAMPGSTRSVIVDKTHEYFERFEHDARLEARLRSGEEDALQRRKNG